MKKFWIKLAYFFTFTSIIDILVCIYKRDLYLIFKSTLLLLFWICTIFEEKPYNKYKAITKFSWVFALIHISLSFLEIFVA